MDNALAELLGLHVGDGTLYKTSRGIVWELRGGLEEQEFYDNYITSLLWKVTGNKFCAKRRSGGKNGCYGFQISNQAPIPQLLACGMPIGTKTYTAMFPACVSIHFSAFLRGLFAADGTFYLTKINGGNIPIYPMIEFCSASMQLRDDVQNLLLILGLKSSIWTYTPKKRGGPTYFLRLSGHAKTLRFSQLVGFINPNHINKFQNYITFKNELGVCKL